MQDKKEAPLEAATSKSAKTKHNQGEDTTKSPAGQGLFQAASVLDDIGAQLGMAMSLLNLPGEQMELASHPKDTHLIPANSLTMYTDSLWVLFRFLEGLQGEAKAQADHFYQERRRVP